MSQPSKAYRRALDAVGWLRTAHENAEPDRRAQQAGLLGLAVADLSDLVDDGDSDLAVLVAEGLDRLAEARSAVAVAAALQARLPLRRGELRLRSALLGRSAGVLDPTGTDPTAIDGDLLDQVVADLTEALGPPWSSPPDLSPLAGARWCLVTALLLRFQRTRRDDDLAAVAAHAFEAAAEQGSAAAEGLTEGEAAAIQRWHRRTVAAMRQNPQAMPHLPVAQWPQAAPRARSLLGVLEPGHRLRPFLRVLSVADVLQEVARTQQWPDGADVLLTELHAVPELWGNHHSAAERQVARATALQLECLRLYVLARRAPDPLEVDLTGLDALVAEYDELRTETQSAQESPSATQDDVVAVASRRAVEQTGIQLGGLLMTRAARAAATGGTPDPGDLARSKELLENAPPELAREATALLQGLPLIRTDVDDLPWAPGLLGRVGELDPDYHDLGGGRLAEVLARARQAIAAQDVRGILDVLPALEDTLRTLPATHPTYPEVMALHACLSGLRGLLDSSPSGATSALHMSIRAAESSALLQREQSRQVCEALALNLVAAIGHDLQVGAFDRAQVALEAALAAGLAQDEAQGLRWRLGAAAASALRWPVLDEPARRATRQLVTDVERALRTMPPDPMTVSTGFMLFMVLANLGIARADPGARVAVVRVLDHLEEVLARPGLADTMMALPGAMMPGQLPGGMPLPGGAAGMRVMLTQLRLSLSNLVGAQPPPMPAPPSVAELELIVAAALRTAVRALQVGDPAGLAEAAELVGRVLARGVFEPVHRDRLHAALGRCLAAAAGVADDGAVDGEVETEVEGGNEVSARPAAIEAAVRLAAAVRHLELATVEAAGPVPTTEHADLLDLLARCYRAGTDPGRATQLARAALREVLGAVLTADTPEQAAEATSRAHRISLRGAWWCVRDGDLEQAVGLAEAGRALLLASVLLTGRVQEYLEDTDRLDLAARWAGGDALDRSAAIGELLTTYPGFAALATPKPGEIAATVIGSSMDAVAYLLPPAGRGGTTGVMLLVGRDRGVRAVPLPGLTLDHGSPLDAYRRAFGEALDAADQASPAETGFRGTPQGRVWIAALEQLGRWAHRAVIAPLLGHVHGWGLGRTAHVALIPLGDLGLIPFAAAWTEDPTRPSGRRYAVHDLVLSYLPSGRLLADVAQRDRLPLGRHVVLATDPTGSLPYSRLAADAARKTLFPDATWYQPDRQAPESTWRPTRADILAALPDSGRDGASLLHLATHGLAASRPLDSTLAAADGSLQVRDILVQATGRDGHAPGGLVICDACLTDVTHARPDESLTLATAFLTAGATGVIGTRWPTDDGASASLVHRLLHELAAGRSPAHALRLAQIAVIDGEPLPPGTPPPLRRQEERSRGDLDWAAFVHHGA